MCQTEEDNNNKSKIVFREKFKIVVYKMRIVSFAFFVNLLAMFFFFSPPVKKTKRF